MMRAVKTVARWPLRGVQRAIGEQTEMLFAVLSLLTFTGAVGRLWIQRSGVSSLPSSMSGYPELRILFYLIYAIAAILLLLRFDRAVTLLRHNWAILLLIVFAIASVLWSVNQELTLRRGMALAATTMFGFYLMTRFSFSQVMQLFGLTFGLAGLLSIGFVFFVPEIGKMPDAYGDAWRGIFPHKNALGQMMVWGAAIALILRVSASRHRRWLFTVAFLLSFVLVLLSRSITSIVLAVLLLPAVAVLLSQRRLPGLSLAVVCFLFVSVLSLGTIIVMNFDETLHLLGRERTFTGRTGIWSGVWEHICDRFWFGYGYGAFWYGTVAPGDLVRTRIDWATPDAHNGWLDTWLSLGATGVALMVASVLSTLARFFAAVRGGRDMEALSVAILLLVFLVVNFMESQLLLQNSISWVIYVIIAMRGVSIPSKHDLANNRLQLHPSRA